MEIRVGGGFGFSPVATPSYLRTPLKRPSKQPPAKVLSSLRFSRNSLANYAVLRRMLSRVLSRLATSPFQSSFRLATSPLPANCEMYLRTTFRRHVVHFQRGLTYRFDFEHFNHGRANRWNFPVLLYQWYNTYILARINDTVISYFNFS